MDYIEKNFGLKNFVFYKVKGEKKQPPEFQKFYEWVCIQEKSFTLENVSEVIDIDNFINNWIVNIFCGNSDPYQGIALLDKSGKGAKNGLLMWDMDHSFIQYI
jgi:spore coat protein CotH